MIDKRFGSIPLGSSTLKSLGSSSNLDGAEFKIEVWCKPLAHEALTFKERLGIVLTSASKNVGYGNWLTTHSYKVLPLACEFESHSDNQKDPYNNVHFALYAVCRGFKSHQPLQEIRL